MILFTRAEKRITGSYFFGGIGVLWVCYGHYFFYGQESVFYGNDYLELVVPWFKHLVDENAVFESSDFMITGMLSELPRGLFPSEFYLETWIYMAFDPFHAILANKFLIHTIAYFSAFHFITSLNIKIPKVRILIYSICWSTMGFWEGAGIGAAAIPSLSYVFFRLYHGDSLKGIYVVFLGLYAFYSYLYLHGLFFISAIFIIGVIGLCKRFKFRFYFYALAILSLFYLIFNYRLIDIYFFQRDWFTPHRIEYDIYSFAAYHSHLLSNSFKLFFTGASHSIEISPFLVLITFLLVIRRILSPSNQWGKAAIYAFLAAFLLSTLSMSVKYLPLIEIIPLLKNLSQFSYERFSFFVAPLTFFSFVILIEENYRAKSSYYVLNSIVLLVIASNVLVINDNLRNKIIKPLTGVGEKYATFKEFYSTDLFLEIKRLLDEESSEDSYMVGSLGIHPAVAIYNNIPSIDGYAGVYSLEYKTKFSQLIEDELKGSDLAPHFFGWGNKCYLFNKSQDDDFLRWKWKDRLVITPKYDYEYLYSMGCRFLISTDPISDVPHIELLGILDDKDSAWILYIYKLKDYVSPNMPENAIPF